MKFPVLSTICLVASASIVLAQAPAPGAPATPGTPTTATTPDDKAKQLSPTDKTLLKKILEGMFFEMNVTDKHKNENAKIDGTKKVAEKVNTDLNKIWGEIAGLLSP